jgi:hypothetical protein
VPWSNEIIRPKANSWPGVVVNPFLRLIVERGVPGQLNEFRLYDVLQPARARERRRLAFASDRPGRGPKVESLAIGRDPAYGKRVERLRRAKHLPVLCRKVAGIAFGREVVVARVKPFIPGRDDEEYPVLACQLVEFARIYRRDAAAALQAKA